MDAVLDVITTLMSDSELVSMIVTSLNGASVPSLIFIGIIMKLTPVCELLHLFRFLLGIFQRQVALYPQS